MDALLLLAIEADKKKATACSMQSTAKDMQSAIVNIGQSIYALKTDVQKVAEVAEIAVEQSTKAANKKAPQQKKQDYTMDVIRGDDGLIMRVDVRAV